MFFVVAIPCAIIFGCDAIEDAERTRPEGVPSEAFFVGGVDGGVYLKINETARTGGTNYRATIFDEDYGTKIYKGGLVLKPEGADPVDVEAEGSFSAWVGDALHLKDGRVMRPVKEIEP